MSCIITLFRQLNHPDQAVRVQANQHILSIVNQPDILPQALQMIKRSQDQLTNILAFTILCKLVKRQPDKTDQVINQINCKSIYYYPKACQISFSDILSVRALFSEQGWISYNIGPMEIPFKMDFVQNLYDNAMLFSLTQEQKKKKLKEGLQILQSWIVGSLRGGQSYSFLQSICEKRFPLEQTSILQAVLQVFQEQQRAQVKLISIVSPYLKRHQFQFVFKGLSVLLQSANCEITQAAAKCLFHSKIYEKQMMRLLLLHLYKSNQSLGLYFDLFQQMYEEASVQNQSAWTYILQVCLIHSSCRFTDYIFQRQFTQDLFLYCYLRNKTYFNQKISDLLKSPNVQDHELLCFVLKAVVQQCQEIQQYKLVLQFISSKCPHEKLNLSFLSCLFYAQSLLDSEHICISILSTLIKLYELQQCCSLTCQCIYLTLRYLSQVNIIQLYQIIAVSLQKPFSQAMFNQLVLLLLKIAKHIGQDKSARYLQLLQTIKQKGVSQFIENDFLYTLIDSIREEGIKYSAQFIQQFKIISEAVLVSPCQQDKKVKLLKLLLEIIPAQASYPLFEQCMRTSIVKFQYLQITANCIDKFALSSHIIAQYLQYLLENYYFQGLQHSLNFIKLMLKSLRLGLFGQSVLNFSMKFISQIKYRKQAVTFADYLKSLRNMGFVSQSDMLWQNLLKISAEKNWIVSQINNIDF